MISPYGLSSVQLSSCSSCDFYTGYIADVKRYGDVITVADVAFANHTSHTSPFRCHPSTDFRDVLSLICKLNRGWGFFVYRMSFLNDYLTSGCENKFEVYINRYPSRQPKRRLLKKYIKINTHTHTHTSRPIPHTTLVVRTRLYNVCVCVCVVLCVCVCVCYLRSELAHSEQAVVAHACHGHRYRPPPACPEQIKKGRE